MRQRKTLSVQLFKAGRQPVDDHAEEHHAEDGRIGQADLPSEVPLKSRTDACKHQRCCIETLVAEPRSGKGNKGEGEQNSPSPEVPL